MSDHMIADAARLDRKCAATDGSGNVAEISE